MLAAGVGDGGTPVKLSQRLAFWLTSVEGGGADAAAQRATLLTAQLMGGLETQQQARQALAEVLKGLEPCSKQAVRLRLQLAAQVLERKLDARAAAAAVPELVQRALQCLSAHCRHDAAATQALATLMAVAARRAAAAAAAPGSNGGTWLYQELLLPLVRSSWRDPEPRRVAAGCSVMAGVLASLAPMVQQPHVALALRAGLVAALEAMWGGATARRVSAAYTPLRQWVAAVGGERLGADGARRLAAICCRGAADKDAWQVRREALLTLAALLAVVQADAREPDWSAALGAQPSSGAVEGIPERQGGVAAPPLGSGAYEALSAQRSRLLAALDGCRHDAIAAVRAAAGEARAAAAGLAARPSESGFKGGSAGGGSGDGGSGGGGGGRASPRRRSLKTLLAPSSSALQGFQRPKLAPGELSDFGIQVYAPPSPPRQLPARPPETDHGQQGRLDREALDGQGGGLASPAGSSLGSRSWSHGGSDQGRQPAQPRDAPLSSPPPAVSTGAAAQWPHAAAEEGHASGVRAAACAGAAPEAASPPGSPPYLYHVQADSVLPGSPGVSRIEVAHTVQGRVELVYGAGGAAAAAVPLLLPSAGGMAGGLLAEAAAHSPLQRARAADGVPLLPGAAASGASRGAARVPSADSCAPMLDAVYNEWQRALPSLHALAQPQPRRAGGAAPASPWPEPLQSAHLGKESGAAAASQRALHRRPSDAADTSPCDAPHCEDAPHAAPGSLSQALAAVHQASSRVGSLLRELSGASVGAKPAASTGIGAATEGPAGSAAPAMVPAAAAAAAGASVAAAAAAAAEGLQLVDAGMCMHSPRPQPGQTGGSKSAGEASAPAPWQQHSTQDARRCSGAATPPVVVVPATAPPAAAQHFDAAGTWQQRTAASGDANAAVTALDAVAAQAPAGSPSSGAAGPAAAAAAPAAQAFSTDSDRARTAAWAPNSEAELLMALSWRLQRLASSGGGSRATASGDPQSAPPEGGMLAGSEPGAGGLDHTLLRARLWASAPGLPPCVTAPQAPGALSTPVPGSSGGGASWDIHRELQLLRDELDNHARQPLASLPSSGTSGGGGRGALPETWDDAHGCAAFSDGGMQAGEGVAQLPPAAAIMLGHLLAEEARARSHSGAAAPPSA